MGPEVLELEAEIVWVGRLDQGRPDSEIWAGTIPGNQYRLSDEQKEHYKIILDGYYVQTTPLAPARCIDGRPKDGMLLPDGSANKLGSVLAREEAIGPQLPGGTPAGALSLRVVIFKQSEGPGANLRSDTKFYSKRGKASGIQFQAGAHEDDHASHLKTGCGAIDNIALIMDRMVDPKSLQAIKGYTKQITGGNYDENAYFETVARLRDMNVPDYKQVYLDEGAHPALGRSLLETVKSQADQGAVETMVGPHKEFAAVVNLRAGETLNRDLLSLDYDNAVQVFNYDAWAAEHTAEKLFSDDDEARRIFIISQAMYFVATAMVLTNGNIEVGIRR